MPLPNYRKPRCSMTSRDGIHLRIKTPFNHDFINYLKQFPGREWDRTNKEWILPMELEEILHQAIVDHFGEPPHTSYTVTRRPHKDRALNPKMYEFQSNAVRDILANRGTGFLNFEMGLGKTPSAIEVLRLLEAERILIVCPAVVRLNWESELQKWWPNAPLTMVADTGKKAEAYLENEASGCFITSYNLLSKFKDHKFAAIVLDESHLVKNSKAARSKAALSLRRKNPTAALLCLSATPITSEPKDFWHQLELLWPGRFGTFWQFVNRYSNVKGNQYGTEIVGVNELHSEELEYRIAKTCHRVTKHEVAHLLPPFLVQTIRVKTKKRWNQREILDALSSGAKNQHDLNVFCEQAGSEKHTKTVELANGLREGGATHVCILTHFKDTARKLAEEFSQDNTFVVTGDLSPKRRMEVIRAAEKLPSATLVCTMHSVGIGIDLTKFTAAVFAELYWQPAVVIQALGRFSRLSGKDPSTCYLLTLEGSLDEPIAHALKRRLTDQAKLFKAGMAEEKALEGFEIPEEEFLDDLRAAAASFTEEEYL